MGATGALTVPTIFTAVDKLSSVVSRMGGSVTKFATNSQKKYANLARSARAVSSSAMSVATSTGIIGAAIIAPLVIATKKAVDFEKQMGNVATLVDTSKESMSAMGTEVLKVFRKVPVPLEDLTHSLYQIRSAGVPAAQAMDVLNESARLAVTGLSTSAEATNALTSAINVFKDENLSALQISGAFFEAVKNGKTTMAQLSESFGATAPIIHAAGITLKDYLGAVSAMTVTGLPATQAMTEIRAAVIAMEKPSTRMAYIFGKLGVKSVQQLLTKYGDLGGAMSAIEEKGTSLGINMAKAWGKVNAIGAVTLLTGLSKNAYTANKGHMANGVTDLNSAYAGQLKTGAAQLELLKNNIQAFAITVGTKLLPVLTKLVDKLSPVIDGWISWIERNPKLTTGILKTVAAIGAFMLIVSPIAMIVSGIAKAIELWSVASLFFATRAAASAAAADALTASYAANSAAAYEAAYATEAMGAAGALGLGGILGVVAAIAATIIIVDQNWKAWGASVTAMLGPLGQVFNMLRRIHNDPAIRADVQQEGGVSGNWHGFSRGMGDILSGLGHSTSKFFTSPFQGVAGMFGKHIPVFGDNDPNKEALLTPQAANSTKLSQDLKNILTVNINDPNGLVSNSQMTGPLPIPVKVTSTTGQGGSSPINNRLIDALQK